MKPGVNVEGKFQFVSVDAPRHHKTVVCVCDPSQNIGWFVGLVTKHVPVYTTRHKTLPANFSEQALSTFCVNTLLN